MLHLSGPNRTGTGTLPRCLICETKADSREPVPDLSGVLNRSASARRRHPAGRSFLRRRSLFESLEVRRLLAADFLPADASAVAGEFATDPPAAGSRSDDETPFSRVLNAPLAFETNLGQAAERFQFVARGPGYGVYLDQTEAVLQLDSGRHQVQIAMQLVGGDPSAEPQAQQRLGGASNYLWGNDPQAWLTDVPHFGRILYRGVYDGIDVAYYGTSQRQLEYDFIVSPGADHRQISLEFSGADSLAIDDAGNLVLAVGDGHIVQPAPLVYQVREGERTVIESAFTIGDDGRVAFDVGRYDEGLELVIDPRVIYFSYLGGDGRDEGHAIAVDDVGGIWIAGSTESADFPTDLDGGDPLQATLGGGRDGFVRRFDFSIASTMFATYLGGSLDDEINDLAVDSSGDAFLVGTTRSPNFPVTTENTLEGDSDAFVARLSFGAGGLVFSDLVGGERDEQAAALTLGENGELYVVGQTDSSQFPTGFGSQSFHLQGDWSGTLVQGIDENGSGSLAFDDELQTIERFQFSTDSSGQRVAGSFDNLNVPVDEDGSFEFSAQSGNLSITVSGFLLTPRSIFGSVEFLLQANGGPDPNGTRTILFDRDGGTDAFLAELDAGTGTARYATTLGGDDDDAATSVALAANGQLAIVGHTRSDNFPTLAFPQSNAKGGRDGFFVVVDPAVLQATGDGSGLISSAYFGGAGDDVIQDVAVEIEDTFVVVGTTDSPDLPTTPGAVQPALRGGDDAFLARFVTAGAFLLNATYLGGTGDENATSVAIDEFGQAYVAGVTRSEDGSFPLVATLRSGVQAAGDIFLMKLDVAGRGIHFSTVHGGGGTDQANDVAVRFGEVFLTGFTGSNNLGNSSIPIDRSIPGILDTSRGASFDAFAMIVRPDLVVNRTDDLPDADPLDGVADVDPATPGLQTTLRAAIETANRLTAGFLNDTIRFDVPVPLRDPSGFTIVRPTSQLPAVTDEVQIQGTSVLLDGSSATGASGLVLEGAAGLTQPGAAGSRVFGLEVHGFPLHGILLDEVSGVSIDSVDVHSNGGDGLRIQRGNQNEFLRGDIFANTGVGLHIADGSNNVFAFGDIEENRGGGVSIAGSLAEENEIAGRIMDNGDAGVLISNASRNVVTSLISGNAGHGVHVTGGASSQNEVNAAIEFNQGDGIRLTNAGNSLIEFSSLRSNAGSGIVIDGGAANEIRGSIIGEGFDEAGNLLHGVAILNGSTNRVTGNSILANAGHGVLIRGAAASSNQIVDNRIGLFDPGFFTGFEDGNQGDGVHIDAAPSNHLERNAIGGNRGHGVSVVGATALLNILDRNFIGGPIDFFEEEPFTGNFGHGVFIDGAPRTIISGDYGGGGAGIHLGAIASNRGDGVHITGEGAVGTGVQTTFIGAAVFELFDPETFEFLPTTVELPNGGSGVRIAGGASETLIGGIEQGQGNRIHANLGDGVTIDGNDTLQNRILGNSIAGNGQLGIDLGGDGPTLNDLQDADTGANALQNTPELFHVARLETGELSVLGHLHSAANMTYRIELFSSDQFDESSFGEGATFISAFDVTTNDDGNAPFSVLLPPDTDATAVTATATNADGNTSEFSRDPGIYVNSTRDQPDADPGDGVPDADLDAPGLQITFRAALEFVNALASPDALLVGFEIPAEDPGFDSQIGEFRLRPAAGLPVITRPIVIDGSTQTDGSTIVLSGLGAGPDATGLEFATAFPQVASLVIQDFSRHGIRYVPPPSDDPFSPPSLNLQDTTVRHSGGWGVLADGDVVIGRNVDDLRPAGSPVFIVDNGEVPEEQAGGILVRGNLLAVDLQVSDNHGAGIAATGDVLLTSVFAPIAVQRNQAPGIVAAGNVLIEDRTLDPATGFVNLVTDNLGSGVVAFGNVDLSGVVSVSDNAGWGVEADGDVRIGIDSTSLAIFPGRSRVNDNGASSEVVIFDGFLAEVPLFTRLDRGELLADGLLQGGVLSAAGGVTTGHLEVLRNGGAGLFAATGVTFQSDTQPIIVRGNAADGVITPAGGVRLIDNQFVATGGSIHQFTDNGGHGIFAEGLLESGGPGVDAPLQSVDLQGAVDASGNAGWGVAGQHDVSLGFFAGFQNAPDRSTVSRNGNASQVVTLEGAAPSIAPLATTLLRSSLQTDGLLQGGVLSGSGSVRAAQIEASNNGGPGVFAATGIVLESSTLPLRVQANAADGLYAPAGTVRVIDHNFVAGGGGNVHQITGNGGHGIVADGFDPDSSPTTSVDLAGAFNIRDNAGFGVVGERAVSLGLFAGGQASPDPSTVVENGLAPRVVTFDGDAPSLAPLFVAQSREALAQSGIQHGGVLSVTGGVTASNADISRNGGHGVEADSLAASQLDVLLNHRDGIHVRDNAAINSGRVCGNFGQQIVAGSTTLTDVVTGDACDADGDGVDDEIEAEVPDGDGNRDGVPDNQQSNVATLLTLLNEFVTIVSPASTVLANVAITADVPGQPPADREFPHGFLQFRVLGVAPGGAANVTFHLPQIPFVGDLDLLDVEAFVVQETQTHDLDDFGAAVELLAVTAHEAQATLVVSYQDGGPLDDDAQANGMIVDPLGWTVSSAPAVDLIDRAVVELGAAFHAAGRFVDVGAGEVSAIVDFGDGGGAQSLALNDNGTFQLNHLFDQADVFNVTVVVTDSNDNITTSTIRVTVREQVERIVDDGDADFSQTGFAPFAAGFQGDLRHTAGDNSGDQATWTFRDLPAGLYRVSSTWTAHPNRASTATYELSDGAVSLGSSVVNQRQAPDDLFAAGALWEDLGPYFRITSGSLTVRLSDAANGVVVADAARVELLANIGAGPEIQVLADGRRVEVGDVIEFGRSANPVTRTITIRNEGSSVLDLGDVTSSSATFQATGGNVAVLPGQSTVVSIRMQAIVSGDASATISLANNDNDESPFEIAVRGEIFEFSTAVIDNGDAGFSQSGFSHLGFGPQLGYLGDTHFTPGNSSGDWARWTFTGLPLGLYRVSATWVASSDRATNSPFTMRDGTTVVGTALVNQRLAPNDLIDVGAAWEDLGPYVRVESGTLTVDASDQANGLVVADAVRIELLAPLLADQPEIQVFHQQQGVQAGGSFDFGVVREPVARSITIRNEGGADLVLGPVTSSTGDFIVTGGNVTVPAGQSTTIEVAMADRGTGLLSGLITLENNDADESPFTFTVTGIVDSVRVLDDGDVGFTATPAFFRWLGQGFQNDVREAPPTTATPHHTATWTFTDLGPGTYRVSATWTPFATRASNAAFSINGGPAILVNQKLPPGNPSSTPAGTVVQDAASGVWFADLSMAAIPVNGSIVVQLSSAGATGGLLADAIRIERLGASPLVAAALDETTLSPIDLSPVAPSPVVATDARMRFPQFAKSVSNPGWSSECWGSPRTSTLDFACLSTVPAGPSVSDFAPSTRDRWRVFAAWDQRPASPIQPADTDMLALDNLFAELDPQPPA